MLIQEQQVEAVQKQWADAIIAIGDSYKKQQDFVATAKERALPLYNFAEGDILFKPTKAADKPFRPDEKSALSYFVGNDSDHTEDKGFALQPWEKIRFEQSCIRIFDSFAFTIGNYYFTDYEQNTVKVEYTFVYKLDNEGKLKILVHHSSLPYSG